MIPMKLSAVVRMLGAAAASAKEDRTVSRVVTDSRVVRRGDLFFALSGNRFDGHEFVDEALTAGAVACVVSGAYTGQRNCSDSLLRVDSVSASLLRLASQYRRQVLPSETKVIAVTGSNGKTTTKNLIHHVLSGDYRGCCAPKSFNNHIGVPLTLLAAGGDDQFVVAEIGTNAPGEIDALSRIVAPDVAVITGIAEAHLDGFGDVHGVAAEKAAILRHVRPGGVAFVNGDCPELAPHYRDRSRLQIRTFGLALGADYRVGVRESNLERTRAVINDRWEITVPLVGACHATNAAAAFAVARWMAMDTDKIAERLRDAPSTSGRVKVLRLEGLTVVDDTYNANPGSMHAAVVTLASTPAHRRVLVMGDMLELGARTGELHDRILSGAMVAGIDLIVGIGRETCAAIRRALCSDSHTHLAAFPEAGACVDTLPALIRRGDVVWCKGSRKMALEQVVKALSSLGLHKLAVA